MNFNITVQACFVFLGCFVIFTIINGQTLVYYCNFDADLVDNCIFNKSKGASRLTTVSGIRPTYLKPPEPLSDVTSIQSLTTPNNESCIFPYNYSTGNWSMYFCEWNSSNNFICPTVSGIGHCIIGKYAQFKVDVGDFNETYSTNVNIKSNSTYCLDFFYYFTNTSDDAKISVGWKSNETIATIVEVTALSENRWQQSRTSYISSSSAINQIWFRMTRNNVSSRILTYALDEIKIFEGSCVINSFLDTIKSDNINNQANEISTSFTTEDIDTTSTTILDTTLTTVPDITSTISLVTTSTTIFYTTTTTVSETTSTTSIVSTSTTTVDTTTTTVFETTYTTVIESTTGTDKIKWTTNDDVQTTDIFGTTNEEMNVTTSNTSDTNFTTITSHTGSPTFHTTSTSNTATISSTKNTDLIINLSVPLGLGVPALFVIIGGLSYHYRKGQLRSKALSDRTDANEIPMTVRNA